MSKGFTLVEMLIVISIIGVLSAVGLASYTSFLKNSRDAKRQADLKFIQTALENYHADQIYYPILSPSSCPETGDGKLRFGCSLTDVSGVRTYIAGIPKDPQSPSRDYAYEPKAIDGSTCNNTTVKCTNYCLFAKMEGFKESEKKTEGSCKLEGAFSSYNFALTRP